MRVLDIHHGLAGALGLRGGNIAAVGVDQTEVYRAVSFQLEVD